MKRIIFAAKAGDVVGEKAISILRKEDYPTVILHPFEHNLNPGLKNKLLVIFFTPKSKNSRKHLRNCKLRLAAYLFSEEKEAEDNSFLAACSPKLGRGDSSAIINAAKDYCKWGEKGFPIDVSGNNSFLPWGEAPTGNTGKRKLFLRWAEKAKAELKS